MFIVLTSEQEITNEAKLLNQLFNAGLEVLHLRKPSFKEEAYRSLLQQIEAQFYNRIMLHEYHHLCEEFNLKGIHIQEQPRLDLGNDLKKYVNRFKINNFIVSSSFHEPEVLASCQVDFDYHLLSPVFSSISKKGYEGRGFDVSHIDKKIVGMGGINTQTTADTFKLGYTGIGVLGGVWNTIDLMESFQHIKQHYDTYSQGEIK
ncbi:thiamine phosphate synthase [Kordia sp.]|uniref:thiamine phosphate synthase n=1 Tax=Kordia sp. TaxID=1965332 RepID=UPI0025C459FD|nr:thiamine phosphate synthase [Kordia sp.]MCH2193663.1 thiamine phosphate synthase [Kordia sp.]